MNRYNNYKLICRQLIAGALAKDDQEESSVQNGEYNQEWTDYGEYEVGVSDDKDVILDTDSREAINEKIKKDISLISSITDINRIKEILLELSDKLPALYEYVSDDIKRNLSTDREFMLTIITIAPSMINQVSEYLLNDYDFIEELRKIETNHKFFKSFYIPKDPPPVYTAIDLTEIKLPVSFTKGFLTYSGQCGGDALTIIALYLYSDAQRRILMLPNSLPSDQRLHKIYKFLLWVRERLIINLERPSDITRISAGAIPRRSSFICSLNAHELVKYSEDFRILTDIITILDLTGILSVINIDTHSYPKFMYRKKTGSSSYAEKKIEYSLFSINPIKIRSIICTFQPNINPIGHSICYFKDFIDHIYMYDDRIGAFVYIGEEFPVLGDIYSDIEQSISSIYHTEDTNIKYLSVTIILNKN